MNISSSRKNRSRKCEHIKMKKLFCLLLCVLLLCFVSGCQGYDENTVIIYSSSEEFRNEHVMTRLKEKFPHYNVRLTYLSTGKNAAKVKSEGRNSRADIILGLETGYLTSIQDVLADLSDYDVSHYTEDAVTPTHKYLVWERFGGGVIINRDLLEDRGLPIPSSYQDLLNPVYQDLICMPNPKSSSTGFMFLKNLCNEWGEEEALKYFDQLSKNIYQFSSSGSGPVNALVQGEAGIGLGMIFQAVQEINKGAKLEILFFEEGAPYSMGGMAMIDGKQTKKAVKEVFDYIADTLVYEDKENFTPEQIFKDQINTIQNYPQNIPYANMTGLDDMDAKMALLEKWKY